MWRKLTRIDNDNDRVIGPSHLQPLSASRFSRCPATSREARAHNAAIVDTVYTRLDGVLCLLWFLLRLQRSAFNFNVATPTPKTTPKPPTTPFSFHSFAFIPSPTFALMPGVHHRGPNLYPYPYLGLVTCIQLEFEAEVSAISFRCFLQRLARVQKIRIFGVSPSSIQVLRKALQYPVHTKRKALSTSTSIPTLFKSPASLAPF